MEVNIAIVVPMSIYPDQMEMKVSGVVAERSQFIHSQDCVWSRLFGGDWSCPQMMV